MRNKAILANLGDIRVEIWFGKKGALHEYGPVTTDTRIEAIDERHKKVQLQAWRQLGAGR